MRRIGPPSLQPQASRTSTSSRAAFSPVSRRKICSSPSVPDSALRAQLVHRAAGADRPVRDDRHAIAHRFRHFERVRAHHDRVAAARVLAEQILEDLRRLRVEPDHRLVHDDHFGPVHERARDDQLLPHAVAVALDELVAPILEIEQRQQLARAMLDLRPVLIVQAGDESQELRAGQLLIDEGAVGDESEPLLRADRIRQRDPRPRS